MAAVKINSVTIHIKFKSSAAIPKLVLVLAKQFHTMCGRPFFCEVSIIMLRAKHATMINASSVYTLSLETSLRR